MRLYLFILAVLVVSGCASTPDHAHYPKYGMSLEEGNYLYRGKASVDLKNTELVRKKLLEQYSKWKGTRYAFGGLSRNGIDCSGLVQLTYLSGLGIQLPRTTKTQVRLGKEVTPGELQAGDLIFFKTGYATRHVGIYMGSGRFFHASKSKGVTISNMENEYWSDNYWVSKRIH